MVDNRADLSDTGPFSNVKKKEDSSVTRLNHVVSPAARLDAKRKNHHCLIYYHCLYQFQKDRYSLYI